MRSNARVVAFFAVLAVLVAGLYAGHYAAGALRWLLGEVPWQRWDGFSERRRSAPGRLAVAIGTWARSLACRPEPRHARPPPGDEQITG
jgi:hypothetical protein